MRLQITYPIKRFITDITSIWMLFSAFMCLQAILFIESTIINNTGVWIFRNACALMILQMSVPRKRFITQTAAICIFLSID